jgi:DNA-binding transcriptional ArsR family regulator
MSIRATAWAWSVETASATHKLVLLALAEHADEAGHCWPSVPRMARMSGVSERTILRTLPEIEAAGLVDCERRSGRPTHYRLRISATIEAPPAPPQPLTQRHRSDDATPVMVSGEPLTARHGSERVTRDTVSPHPCHRVTPPLTGCHGTPDTVSPEPSRTVIEPPVNRQLAPRDAAPPTPRGTRLDAAWTPGPDDAGFAASLGLDPDAAAAEFRDYWLAVPGAKGRKLDWPATFRNSCRMQAAKRAPRKREDARPWWMEDLIRERH